MNAALLIAAPSGNSGVSAVGQPAADASKGEARPEEASFGQVLEQVGKQVDRATEVAEGQTQPGDADESEQDLSPLPITLALQASLAASVQAGQGSLSSDGAALLAAASSDEAQLSATLAESLYTVPAQAGAAPSSQNGTASILAAAPAVGVDGALPVETAPTGSAAGLTQAAQSLGRSSGALSEPAGQVLSVEQAIAQHVQSGEAETVSDPVAEVVPGGQRGDLLSQTQSQEQAGPIGIGPEPLGASAAVAGANVIDRKIEQPAPAVSAPRQEGASAKAGTMAEANINAGQPAQTPSAINAGREAESGEQAGLKDQSMADQARQVAALGQAGKAKESGKGAKTAPASQPEGGAERFGIGLGEGRSQRIDGAAKVAAAAPVALPAEPVAASAVQSLRFDVERPDLGGVQVRVVLADQTVHAKVTTGQVEVRDFLVARQDQLASGLKASGLEMGEFQVDVDPQGRGQDGPGWFAGSQGEPQYQGQRQPEARPDRLYGPEPRAEEWVGSGNGYASGAWERRALNVFA